VYSLKILWSAVGRISLNNVYS